MPYTLKVEGMDEITAMLKKAEDGAQGIAARALYVGAGIVADEISKGARGVNTSRFRYANGWQRDPSPEEKAAVVSAGVGISKFTKTGNEVDTSVGYSQSGYAEINGKRKAVAVIANSINSGTSFMKKQPFFRKAATRAAPKAVKAMTEKINSVLAEYLDAMSKI